MRKIGEENEFRCFGPLSNVWSHKSFRRGAETDTFEFLWSPMGTETSMILVMLSACEEKYNFLRFLLLNEKQLKFPVFVSTGFAGMKNLSSTL